MVPTASHSCPCWALESGCFPTIGMRVLPAASFLLCQGLRKPLCFWRGSGRQGWMWGEVLLPRLPSQYLGPPQFQPPRLSFFLLLTSVETGPPESLRGSPRCPSACLAHPTPWALSGLQANSLPSLPCLLIGNTPFPPPPPALALLWENRPYSVAHGAALPKTGLRAPWHPKNFPP